MSLGSLPEVCFEFTTCIQGCAIFIGTPRLVSLTLTEGDPISWTFFYHFNEYFLIKWGMKMIIVLWKHAVVKSCTCKHY